MVSYRQGGMYMSCRVLLAEDDRALGETIVDYLTAKSGGEMELIWVQDGAGACSILNKLRFQLVLLDIMLPGMDGFTLCRELRKHSNAPVMFLTARGLEEDKLRGYELGCDDYLVKPFSLAELYVRARALLRRSGEGQDPPPLTAGKIQLSAQTGRVWFYENTPEPQQIEGMTLRGNGDVPMLTGMAQEPAWAAELVGDEEQVWAMLRRVLENFLSNAIRYTTPGGTVRVEIRQRKCTVKNPGQPIPTEELERIWEAHYQRNPARSEGGSGLGLSIAREILHRHGFSWGVQNGPEGPEFWFSF